MNKFTLISYRIFFIIIIVLLFISCSKSTFLFKPTSFYSRLDMDFSQLENLYSNTPPHQGKELEKFVKEIRPYDQDLYVKSLNFSGVIECQVFVDTTGQVESVFVVDGLYPHLDSLAVDALKQSTFKKMQMHGKLNKYSVIVRYLFINGSLITTDINKTPLEKGIDSSTRVFDSYPKMIYFKPVYYLGKLNGANIEGTVIVKVVVDEYGRTFHAQVVDSDKEYLNEYVIEAAFLCRFVPAVSNGKKVKSVMLIRYFFPQPKLPAVWPN